MVIKRGNYRGDQESVSDGKINEGNRRSTLPPIHEPRTSMRSYPPPEAGRRIAFPPQYDGRKAETKNIAQSQGMLPKVQGVTRGTSKFKGYVPGLTIRDAERRPIKDDLSYIDKAMGKPTHLFPDVKDGQGIAARHMQKIIKLKPKELISFDVIDVHEPQLNHRYERPHLGAGQPKVSPRSREGTPKPQSRKLHTPTKGEIRMGGNKLPSLGGGRPGTSQPRRGGQNHY